MKHLKNHKTLAIVLSCFGSVIEQEKYKKLKLIIEKEFSQADVFLAFSSRIILNHLKKKNIFYKNLPQVLADVDMLGYNHIIVSSINIFPTYEHNMVKSIVKGFNQFSLANIQYTNSIFYKNKQIAFFLKNLDNQVTKKNMANLYIIHGTPKFNTKGIETIKYTNNFLKSLDPLNFTCFLEGKRHFVKMQKKLKKQMKDKKVKKVQLVPILLVSGNHYKKDVYQIQEYLNSDFEVSIVQTLTKSSKFNLIELPNTIKLIKSNIKKVIKNIK